MDKLTPNENKIIAALQKIDIEVCSKDLAKLSDIHPNSVGRYVKKLTEKGLIEQYFKQIHNKRFRMIKISETGRNHEIIITPVKMSNKKLTKTQTIDETINIVEIKKNLYRDDIKNELRLMILNLVVRKIDYRPMHFNSSAEYRNKMMELIELL